MGLKANIERLSNTILDKVIEIRRHIHQNPELAFEEKETAQYISKVLTEFGIEHQTGVAKTGVVGLIKGKHPNEKCVALRADMDALPITEANTFDYASKNKHKMHACGHDFHTASLLGTAYVLNQLKEHFSGTIKLVFQPSEEKLPGGAKVLIDEGVLENPRVNYIIGQHVSPEIETGIVGFRPGKFMASADEIYLTINGKGGHAAFPHKVIDPVLISAHIIVALQQIVSRNVNPEEPVVLSFGDIHGNGATNIIPNQVKIQGTLRCFNENLRNEIKTKIKSIAQGVAESMGGSCEINFPGGYPYLENNVELTTALKKQAQTFLNEQQVIEAPLRMGGEDFSFYSQQIPACFYRIGTGNANKNTHNGLHTSNFNVDEDAFKTSIGLMAWLAIKKAT